MKCRIRLLAILLVVGLLVTACGGSQQQAQATATREPTKVAAATKPPDPTATTVATKPPAVASTPTSMPTKAAEVKPTNTPVATATKVAATTTPADDGGDTLDDVSSAVTGLENLKTYRTKMAIDVEGIKEGKTVTGTFEILGVYNREQKASSITIKSAGTASGDLSDLGGMIEMVQISTTTWVRFGEQWIQSSGTENEMMAGLMLSPKEVVGDLGGLQRVRPDQKVNGVDSRHYRFDEKTATRFQSQAFGGITKYQGEIWIAKGDDEYVVRITMQGEGEKVDFIDELEDGKLRFTYDVYDVNKPITIEPPTTAAPTLPGFKEGELPIVEGAEIKLSMEGMVILQTEEKPENVVKFYQESLKKLGWEAEGEPMEAGDVSILRFTKGKVSLNIMVTVDKDTKKTAVTLIAQEDK